MKRTETAGGIVVGPQGKILVVSQHGLSWSLPKGHIDPGETDLEAATREVREESGVTQLKLVEKIGEYERFRIGLNEDEDKNELKKIIIFLFTTSQANLKPEDPENPEARWVDPDSVANLLTHKKDKQFFTAHMPRVKKLIEKSS